MGQGSAERYVPAAAGEVCVSITTPGDPDADLSPLFASVLRLQFADDSFDGWRERNMTITHRPGSTAAVTPAPPGS